jgi:ribonuclease P protein component
VIDCLRRSADFERVLRTRTRANSAHFAVHHLAGPPSAPARRFAGSLKGAAAEDLSTGRAPVEDAAVDESVGFTPPQPHVVAIPGLIWLGTVVPKRHARRAVTRTLLKRQIRTAVAASQSALADGLWVVRLRAPFDRARFPSAASDALKQVVRGELEQLLISAAARLGRH